MKRLAALLLALCLCLSALPAGAAESGQTTYAHSGSLDLPKLSQSEIAQLLADNPAAFTGEAMAEPSSPAAPYALGQVSQAVLTSALNRFNALRRLAGLGGVTLDPALGEKAQYGAVLLAATGQLTHTPGQPADMDDSFFTQGYTATQCSNIYQGTNATLPRGVEAFFDDSDAVNLPMLGHRRWMLNPTMGKTGLGFSPSAHTFAGQPYHFITCWAFDRSGPGVDYDFIAWPASGSFPTTLFHRNQAWSVTLNPEKYAAPALSGLTVTLTRVSDGRTWTLSGSEAYASADSGAYLNVDTAGYGVANCVVFRPDLGGDDYRGLFTVALSGLKTTEGQETQLTYQVNFFDPDQPESDPYVPVTSVALDRRSLELTVGQTAQLTAQLLPADATDSAAVWSSTAPQVAGVTQTGRVTAQGPGTATIVVTSGGAIPKVDACVVTVTAAGGAAAPSDSSGGAADHPADLPPSPSPDPASPTLYLDVPQDAWFADAVAYTTTRGLFTGVGGGCFDPEGTMTRAMVMTVLARLDGEDTTPQGLETWDIRGRRWAVTHHVSDGLDPDRAITLEELSKMLYTYAQLRYSASPAHTYHLAEMPDGDTVSSWATEGANWAVDQKVLIGDENQLLNPQRTATRAQVAIVLQRFLTLNGV